jgi:hypothetical protein
MLLAAHADHTGIGDVLADFRPFALAILSRLERTDAKIRVRTEEFPTEKEFGTFGVSLS